MNTEQDKTTQRERMLEKQDQMRKALPGQLAWIAVLIVGLLAAHLLVGLLALLFA